MRHDDVHEPRVPMLQDSKVKTEETEEIFNGEPICNFYVIEKQRLIHSKVSVGHHVV